MSYTITINKQAKKKLETLEQRLPAKLIDKINLLGRDPFDLSLDVKRLVGEPLYRLRVGDWRVIFDRQDELKIISIGKIGARGDVYK